MVEDYSSADKSEETKQEPQIITSLQIQITSKKSPEKVSEKKSPERIPEPASISMKESPESESEKPMEDQAKEIVEKIIGNASIILVER